MYVETTVHINAAAAEVWRVLTDVRQWPTWTQSVRKAEPLGSGELAVGARVRLEQPRIPATVWEVTELTPEVAFTWRASRGGVRTTADHRCRATGPRTTTVVLSIDQRGPLAAVVGLLTSGLTRRYLSMEARGLKAHCEA
ncbi:MAG: SRPBCC family protein [Actinomycetota bacterium]|nr:SRPBCC family protein [Actinomycetota bacterium]